MTFSEGTESESERGMRLVKRKRKRMHGSCREWKCMVKQRMVVVVVASFQDWCFHGRWFSSLKAQRLARFCIIFCKTITIKIGRAHV